MRIGITGANGYVGSLLTRRFASEGHEPIAFVRAERLAASSGSDGRQGVWRPYEIARPPAADALEDLDVLIHCAWDLSIVSEGAIWGANVAGTEQLLRNATKAGVRRTIFISSMSAYDGTRQLYGQSKLTCERTALGLGCTVVRLGLVYGPGWGGMIGALRKMARLPVTPLIGARSHQFTVHEDDVGSAIVRIASAAEVPVVPLGLAHPDPVGFRVLMSAIASADGQDLRAIPVPWQAIYVALRVGETLRVPLPFRADSILGLVHPASGVPGVIELAALGIRLRPFSLDVPPASRTRPTDGLAAR